MVLPLALALLVPLSAAGQQDDARKATLPPAVVDGRGEGWRSLGSDDFVNVNCHEDTWTWDGDSVKCTGTPIGVTRSVEPYTNFEMVCEWRHMRDAGNSGIFLWSPIESMDRLKGPGLPEGIEWQELKDHFAEIGDLAFVRIKGGARHGPRKRAEVRLSSEKSKSLTNLFPVEPSVDWNS